jgi:hypothetical protein
MSAQKIVMVTGGSGLVGRAIQEVIEGEKNADEKWIYLSSKVREGSLFTVFKGLTNFPVARIVPASFLVAGRDVHATPKAKPPSRAEKKPSLREHTWLVTHNLHHSSRTPLLSSALSPRFACRVPSTHRTPTHQDGNLTDAAETAAIFDKYQPTHVIHLAAQVGGLFANMKHKVQFWRNNIMMNDNIFQECHKRGAFYSSVGWCERRIATVYTTHLCRQPRVST